ncbi:cyclin-dependent kinase 14 isoform X5 [Danio rerio]
MSTRSCQGSDSVIKPLDTIPEDKKVRVQRTQSGFEAFDKPASQVKRVHSENNACINAKSSSSGKESPKLRRHSSPSSPTSPKFGKADSYEKLEKLGEGSYATVYKGKSKVNGKLVALKVIRLQEEEGTPFTAIREASLLKGLKHANIVLLHDIIHTKETLTLVFEYVHTDLCQYMDKHPGGLQPDNVRAIFGVIACGARTPSSADIRPPAAARLPAAPPTKPGNSPPPRVRHLVDILLYYSPVLVTAA